MKDATNLVNDILDALDGVKVGDRHREHRVVLGIVEKHLRELVPKKLPAPHLPMTRGGCDLFDRRGAMVFQASGAGDPLEGRIEYAVGSMNLFPALWKLLEDWRAWLYEPSTWGAYELRARRGALLKRIADLPVEVPTPPEDDA